MIDQRFADVQRIVLRGSHWAAARHVAIGFGESSPTARHFLHRLKAAGLWPTLAETDHTQVQTSLGFSRRGLEHVHLPRHVLSAFAARSPAFFAGAALRNSSQVGTGQRVASHAEHPGSLAFTKLDAVFSVHSFARQEAEAAMAKVLEVAAAIGVAAEALEPADRLDQPPPGLAADPQAQWVHFGYRDGLSLVGIRGVTLPERLAACRPSSVHEPGEFVLGHRQNSGANPWLCAPGARVWPQAMREFFRNGSFGVLQQIEQDVAVFEDFVDKNANDRIGRDELKAKLCGRYPDGRPLVADKQWKPQDDFDYSHDRKGYACPFGSHARRMNPRSDGLAHGGRMRPLLRRGMPYGSVWRGKDAPCAGTPRGLMAQFFCASIEDQYEHLVGQWADRVPLGSADRGGARDPLIGAHRRGDGAFVMRRPEGRRAIKLRDFKPFTHTVGIAYLFYPSQHTLQGIADHRLWNEERA